MWMSLYGLREPLKEGNANFGRKKNLVIACFVKSPWDSQVFQQPAGSQELKHRVQDPVRVGEQAQKSQHRGNDAESEHRGTYCARGPAGGPDVRRWDGKERGLATPAIVDLRKEQRWGRQRNLRGQGHTTRLAERSWDVLVEEHRLGKWPRLAPWGLNWNRKWSFS